MDGTFFVTNGRSLHICGTEEDLEAFKSYYEWAYLPEQLETAYPNLALPLSEFYHEIPKEIIQFYHTHREYYNIAPYFAFGAYLESIVPQGQIIIKDHQFFIVSDTEQYQIGLDGEAALFDKWCKENHRPINEEEDYFFYDDEVPPKTTDDLIEHYEEEIDRLEASQAYLEEAIAQRYDYPHTCITPYSTYKAFFKQHPEYLAVNEDEHNYLQAYLPDCVIDAKITPMRQTGSQFYISTSMGNHICGSKEDLEAYQHYCNWQKSPHGLFSSEDLIGNCGWQSDKSITD